MQVSAAGAAVGGAAQAEDQRRGQPLWPRLRRGGDARGHCAGGVLYVDCFARGWGRLGTDLGPIRDRPGADAERGGFLAPLILTALPGRAGRRPENGVNQKLALQKPALASSRLRQSSSCNIRCTFLEGGVAVHLPPSPTILIVCPVSGSVYVRSRDGGVYFPP